MKKTTVAPKSKLQLARMTVADLKQVNGGVAADAVSKACGSVVYVPTVSIVVISI